MFKKIVVAVDGSETSFNALDKAFEVAKDTNGTLVVCNVSTNVMNETDQNDYDIRNLVSIKKHLDKCPVKYELIHTSGPVAEVINSAVEIEKCDSIIIGDRGHNSLKKMLLGSVSYEVLQNATVPVLIVKKV